MSLDVCVDVGLNDADARASSNQHPAARMGALMPVCLRLDSVATVFLWSGYCAVRDDREEHRRSVQ
jgi:hypothetical protein